MGHIRNKKKKNQIDSNDINTEEYLMQNMQRKKNTQQTCF